MMYSSELNCCSGTPSKRFLSLVMPFCMKAHPCSSSITFRSLVVVMILPPPPPNPPLPPPAPPPSTPLLPPTPGTPIPLTLFPKKNTQIWKPHKQTPQARVSQASADGRTVINPLSLSPTHKTKFIRSTATATLPPAARLWCCCSASSSSSSSRLLARRDDDAWSQKPADGWPRPVWRPLVGEEALLPPTSWKEARERTK